MSDSKLWIVSYMSNGHARATRHRDGCGVLALAQRQHEDRSYSPHIKLQAVVEDDRYQRLVARGSAIAAKDHSCVEVVAPETVAQGSLI